MTVSFTTLHSPFDFDDVHKELGGDEQLVSFFEILQVDDAAVVLLELLHFFLGVNLCEVQAATFVSEHQYAIDPRAGREELLAWISQLEELLFRELFVAGGCLVER